MSPEISQLMIRLQTACELGQPNLTEELLPILDGLESGELAGVMVAACELTPPQAGSAGEKALVPFCTKLAAGLLQEPLTPPLIESTFRLARHLQTCSAGEILLVPIARRGDDSAIADLCGYMVESPPLSLSAVGQIFAALFQREDYRVSSVFPKLLDGVGHLSIAAPMLDLANYLFRKGRVKEHPAAKRVVALRQLLGELAGQLSELEEQPATDETVRAHGLQISESVALMVALCDALALAEDEEARGKLQQVLPLKHRRLRTEAAAALIRLGDDSAKQELLALAAEPVARLRVLAYADELDMLDEVPEEYRTAKSRAEAELTNWLAEPTQFGYPPIELEMVDERELFWPGYDDPVESFLFRFVYEFPEQRVENYAIAGPTCCTFAANLLHLEFEDVYAAFAGAEAEHEEIHEQRVVDLGDQSEVERLVRPLRSEGYVEIQPLKLCFFFGDRVLLALAKYEGEDGVVIADGQTPVWFSAGGATTVNPDLYLNIYKGRRLMRAFGEAEVGEQR